MCFKHSFPDCLHRVLISNLQTEIEKQIGHQSSRKRRSEFQYDYEVYHPLGEVSAWMKIHIHAIFYEERWFFFSVCHLSQQKLDFRRLTNSFWLRSAFVFNCGPCAPLEICFLQCRTNPSLNLYSQVFSLRPSANFKWTGRYNSSSVI